MAKAKGRPMPGLIQKNRMRMERDLRARGLFWKFSPAVYVLLQRLPAIRAHAGGRLLDVGCGTMPFREFLENQLESYDGLDVERRSPETKFICDAQEMNPIADASYDTVLSVSALEHMPRPWQCFSEIARVTRPGGRIVIIVPHLSRYHEEPFDFFRFTAHGLNEMGRANGLEVIEIEPVGGLFAFLGHQVSTIVLGLAWHVPVLRWVLFWVNYALCVRGSILLDRLFATAKIFPMDILAIFSKPDGAAGGGTAS